MAQKKTTSNNKKNSNKADTIEQIVIAVLFIILIAAGIYMFYYDSNTPEQRAATVNGYDITEAELNWWYDLSVKENYRSKITKLQFLKEVVIPQTIIEQEALSLGLDASEEEIEKVIGLYMIEEGLTKEEFNEMLEKQGLTKEDLQKSFRSRVLTIKLFEKKLIDYTLIEGKPAIAREDIASQDYINDLIDNAEVEIHLTQKTMITKTGKSCDEKTIRLFITTTCTSCEESSNIFKRLITKDLDAKLWVLDEGDDELTSKKESGIPKDELAFFNKYADKKVPALIIGCEYKYVGPMTAEVEQELSNQIEEMVK